MQRCLAALTARVLQSVAPRMEKLRSTTTCSLRYHPPRLAPNFELTIHAYDSASVSRLRNFPQRALPSPLPWICSSKLSDPTGRSSLVQAPVIFLLSAWLPARMPKAPSMTHSWTVCNI